MIKVLIVDDQSGWRDFNSNAVYAALGKDTLIDTASSAHDGYNKLLENSSAPYDFLITDMQMEVDYAPKMAGEWLIEQTKMLRSYYKTKIIIISASPKIKSIAESYGVFYIPKRAAVTSIGFYKDILCQ